MLNDDKKLFDENSHDNVANYYRCFNYILNTKASRKMIGSFSCGVKDGK